MGEIAKVKTVNNLKEVAALQANAGLRFTLLGKKYLAAFEKGAAAGDISFVIMPDPTEQVEVCSLSKLCEGLNGVVKGVSGSSDDVFDATQMGEQIKQYTSSQENVTDDGDLNVTVRQLFLYIHKQGDNPLDVQYAISLSLDLSEIGLNLGDVVSMDSVWVSLWNTGFENIIDKMEIEDIEKLIQQQ